MLGMIPATIQIVGHPDMTNTEVIYVAKEVKGLFISRRSLQDLGCLPTTWPHPADRTLSCSAIEEENLAPCGCPTISNKRNGGVQREAAGVAAKLLQQLILQLLPTSGISRNDGTSC